jgi:rubrerythrin
MRSQKSRSRNKNNRNRPQGGNVINRVFDSSGPEGKVRGTPQQIIDKYNQLARDAQLSGDRVATENFQQHAEHYTRMLAEAQREMQERQDRQQQQQQHNNNNNNQQNNNQQDRSDNGQDNQPRAEEARDDQAQTRQNEQPQDGDRPRRGRRKPEPRTDDVIETGGEDSGLVETPESAPAPKRSRRSRQKAEVVETEPAQDAAE